MSEMTEFDITVRLHSHDDTLDVEVLDISKAKLDRIVTQNPLSLGQVCAQLAEPEHTWALPVWPFDPEFRPYLSSSQRTALRHDLIVEGATPDDAERWIDSHFRPIFNGDLP